MEPKRVESLRLTSEEVLLAAGGKMASLTVQTPSDALKLTLLMMMKHTADVHLTVLEIIAEKYTLNLDEMVNTVNAHPRWHEILQTPLVSDLSALAIAQDPVKPKSKPAAKTPPLPTKSKSKIKIADVEEEIFE